MPMAPGEAEPAATVGPFDRPGHVLRFLPFEHRGTHMRIVLVRPFRALQRRRRRQGRQDRDDALHAVAELHVVIPLVVRLEGTHATGDGMPGKRFGLQQPVRIDRPVDFEVPARPVQELLPGRGLLDFNRVVHEDQAHATLHHRVHFREMSDHGMSRAAVRIDHDGRGAFERLGIGRPSVAMDDRLDLRMILLEQLAQQPRSGPMIVRPVGVADGSGDEHDFALRAGCGSPPRPLRCAASGAGVRAPVTSSSSTQAAAKAPPQT